MKPVVAMKLWRSFLLWFLFVPAFVSFAKADVVVTLRDGTPVTVESITMEAGKILLPDGRIFSRDQVKEILYLKGSKGWRYEPTPHDRNAYMAYLAEGERLAEKYPGFTLYAVEDDNVFTWNPDGTYSIETRTLFYLAKEDAKRIADGTVGIEEERFRYVFLALRSISKDLQIRDIDPNRIITAPIDTGTHSFSNYLGVSWHVPEPQIGGLVEVHMRREVYNPFDRKCWAAFNYFQSSFPVSRSSLTVRVPEGMRINFYAHALPKEIEDPIVRQKDGRNEYQWASGEMPAIVAEPYLPPRGDISPFLAVSPFFDWDYLFVMETRLLGTNAVPDERIQRVTAEIVKGAKSDEEKTALIYHWIQQNIRYISIKGSIGSGWGGHPAWLTLQNKFGDCIDKAILMTAMLAACEIQAEVAALMTNRWLQLMDKLPILHGNHAITRVTIGDTSFYLDSTGSALRYPSLYSYDQGCFAFLTSSRKIEKILPHDPSRNQVRFDYKMKMDKQGGLRVERKETATGHTEAGIRNYLKRVQDRDRREGYMREAANLSPRGELVTFKDVGVEDLGKPVESCVTWNLPNYVRQSGELLYFSLPYVQTSFSQISLPQRKYDLYINSSYSQVKNYELVIPRGYAIQAIPRPLSVQSPYYSVQARYEVDGRAIRFHYRYDQHQGVVPVGDYPAYREGLLKVEKYLRQKIFLAAERRGKE